MKLRYSPTSPFVRKAVVSAKELGVMGRIELVATNVWDPETDIGDDNPLGKVPALTLDDGTVLWDSPVICEYLDSLVPAVALFPNAGSVRWKALRFQALADGITDAGVLRLIESRRTDSEQSKWWVDRQTLNITRGLDVLEQEIDELAGGPLTIGQISVACCLGWLLFRFPGDNLLGTRPNLKAWFDEFSKRPTMIETEPKE